MRLKINLILLFALFAVSTSSIIARFLPGVSAVVIAFWRLFIASIILWSYTIFNKQPTIGKNNLKFYILSGLFLAFHFTSFYTAVKLTSIANATLLGITAPMFTILYERFFLRRRFGPFVFLGLVMAVTGTIFITGSGLLQNDGSFIGKLFGLLAALFISLVYILAGKLRKDSNTLSYTRVLYAFGALFLLLISLLGNHNVLEVSLNEVKWLCALGIVPTILGHSLFYFSIKFTSPTIVASVPIGEPIIASILAWFLFSEVVSISTLTGGVFILSGIYFLVMYSPKQQNN